MSQQIKLRFSSCHWVSPILTALLMAAGCRKDDGNTSDYQSTLERIRAATISELRLKAEQGNIAAQYDLGHRYALGQGVTKDYSLAAKWFRKAAEQGDAKSQGELGALYGVGLGVPKDAVEAVRWLRKSAEQGSAVDQFNLGAMYSRGEGVPKDSIIAAQWYRRAADQGFAKAEFVIGAIYGVGEGVDKNEAEAIEWMRKAAFHSDFTAQLSLGVRYGDGIGVPKDLVEAFKWLNLGAQGLRQTRVDQSSNTELLSTGLGIASQAASHPFDDAALELFERLKNELTPEQLAEAHKRIAEFTEKKENRP